MAQWIYLSYLLNEDTPAYGGGQAFFSKADKKIIKGDSCNTTHWSMSNHIGTHIDFPRHFHAKGKTADKYPADFWVIKHTKLVEALNVQPGHILTENDIPFETIPADTQLLLIKTGFYKLRTKEVYWKKNPGISPDLSVFLKDRFAGLRILGFDSISLSSFTSRNLGRKAHKAFLDDRPLLLLEDMDLRKADSKSAFKQVIISPLRVHQADGAPCTVMAEIA